MVLWDELPGDLLDQILKRMTHHLDVVQFGLVCKSWSSVALEGYACVPKQLPLCFCFPQPKLNPLLIFPSKGGSEYGSFYSVTRNEIAGQFSLPEAQGKWPCSTSFGWILMVDIEDPEEISLCNPVTRAQIQLPPFSTFPKFPLFRSDKTVYDHPGYRFIKKAVLSVDPSEDPDNWILMAIVSFADRLCFCRATDRKWTLVGSGPANPPWEEIHMEDAIYYSGKFYAVNSDANIFTTIVGSHGSVQPKFEVFSRSAHEYDATNYLVISSGGELLQVARFVDRGTLDCPSTLRRTEELIAYKFNSSNNDWNELEHLGDDVLFLGQNASFCLSIDKVPGIKTNCIYLTDDSFLWDEDGKQWDSGIYNYEDCLLQEFDVVGPCSHMPPLWIIPSISH